MLKCVKVTSFFFVLLFELLPDTTSTVSGDCDFLRSCVNYKYREKKKMLLSRKPKTFNEFFISFHKSTSISEYFEENVESHSLSISEINGCERGG